MKKVYVLAPSEDWVVDRFVDEWTEDNNDITTMSVLDADVIWLLSNWCWTKVPYELLRHKKVITTIHHIVPEKFGRAEREDFKNCDQFTTLYHVYNQRTFDVVKSLTDKDIRLIPYWYNQRLWRCTDPKDVLRKRYNLPQKAFICGSFQRDTEGHDLISPKLEKGPDRLADALEVINGMTKNLHVLLAGWRRQYIIKRLKAAGISYTYIEKPNNNVLNDLYQTLDLYLVTARHEGGPQALIECGLLNVPVVSTPVGIAEQVLPSDAIDIDVTRARACIPHVHAERLIPAGYALYRRLIEEI